MTTDITELAQSLKAAAEKATPGEWVYFPKNTSIEYDVGSDESQGSILYVDSGDFTQAQTDRNGEFIALANPANILALVEALGKAQTKAIEQGRTACELFDEVTALRQRIAELESRTVKLPEVYGYLRENDGQIQISIGAERPSNRSGGYATPWFAIYTAAGIKVEAE